MADQIHQAVSAGTRTDHSGHCHGTQSARLAGLSNCDIQCLQSVLNTAVRLVAGASRWDDVTRLLRDHQWLPVKQRIEYKLCMTVRRCLHGEAPRYLADLITPSAAATARAGLRSATSGYVAVSRTMSSLGDRSFAVAAPRSWNKLPSPLRRADSVNTFKRQLKTVLLPRPFSFLIFRFCILLGALVVFRALTSP